MDPGLAAKLQARADSHRRVRFDDYQRIVLYDPDHGYFATSARRAGRDGDFLTSPEVAPLFAECLARVVVEDAAHFGTDEFHVLEVGAGRGTLARDLWKALEFGPAARRVRFHLVEAGAAARAELERTLSALPAGRWRAYADVDDLPQAPWPAGILLANELFDNLPVRRVMQTNRLQEIVVKLGARVREELVEAPVELGAYLEAQGVRLSTGQTAEICLEAPQLLARLVARFERGGLVLVDYGDEARFLYDPERFPHGTLAAHRGHTVNTDFYAEPGRQDLTAHVNFTPLRSTAEAAGYKPLFFGSQTKFLLENGLPEILQRHLARAPDDFERLRLTQWAKQLYHPEAMGEAFRVLRARTP